MGVRRDSLVLPNRKNLKPDLAARSSVGRPGLS
jgi:hypothetical protein